MENKPNHYDGSIQNNEGSSNQFTNEEFILTDEIRMNISGNPFFNESN